MKDYRQLAFLYLKHNRKRTIVTIIGAALCVAVLFAIMNFAVSYVVTKWNIRPEKTDFGIRFVSVNIDTAQKIAVEDLPDKDVIGTLLLSVLLVSYIFAILGVGIVRNAISLTSLEQMQDYGILRCIGATKKQLKSFIYLMGSLLELGGIVLGITLGFLIYLALAAAFRLQIGFHIIVLPFILLAFWGDLYFLMQENTSFVNRMSPITAVQGGLKPGLISGKEKIKMRKTRVIGKLFGFEGEYAFKSLMRNPARFWKTVSSIGFGIGMVIVAVSINNGVDFFLNGTADHYGFYQLFDYSPVDAATISVSASRSDSDDTADRLLASSLYITASKPLYNARFYTQDPTELEEHFTPHYKNDSYLGTVMQSRAEAYKAAEAELEKTASEKTASENAESEMAESENAESEMAKSENAESGKRDKGVVEAILSGVDLFGYDEEDYRRLKKDLVSGTLDLSEQGILLVNHAYTYSAVQTDLSGQPILMDYTVTDYQVGDHITFVDFAALYELTGKRIAEEKENAEEETSVRLPIQIMNECLGELAAQGITRTYVIEGIVERDATLTSPYGSLHFVLPLERFFKATGLTEDASAGRMFHLKGKRLDEPLKNLCQNPPDTVQIDYLQIVQDFAMIRVILFWIMFFVAFVVLLNIINILNTASANLCLRSNEFAQLRVLGMSQKRLIRTVFLESILTAVFADIFGLLLGMGISAMLMRLINLLYYVEFHFPLAVYLLTAGISFILFGGSVCFNLSHLKVNLSEELNT